jgi:hypothetical protein
MGVVFNHSKTQIHAGVVAERGHQLNAPFQISSAGTYTLTVDARLHGLPSSSVQLETMSFTGQAGVRTFQLAHPSATFQTNTKKSVQLSLNAGTYRLAVQGADVYGAMLSS